MTNSWHPITKLPGEDLSDPAWQSRRPVIDWTPEDTDRLRRMKDQGLPWREIFAAFPTRTHGAVKSRYHAACRLPRLKKYPPALRFDAAGMEIGADVLARERSGGLPPRPATHVPAVVGVGELAASGKGED